MLVDPAGTLSIDQVASPQNSAKFIPLNEKNINSGYTRSTIWIRFQMQNQAERENWLLAVEESRLSWVDFYRPAGNSAGFERISTGAYRPFSTRELPFLHYLFRLPLTRGSQETVYLRLQTDTVLLLPMRVISWNAFHAQSFSLYLGLGLFYGAVAILTVNNLYLFFSLRDHSYLMLVFFIIFSLLYRAGQDGTGQQFIWPGASSHYVPLAAGFSGNFFFLGFVITYLRLKTFLPDALPVFILLMVLSAVAIPGLLYFPDVITLMPSLTILSTLAAVLTAVRMSRRGFRPQLFYQSVFYHSAWVCLLLVVFTTHLFDSGVIQSKALLYLGSYAGLFLMSLLWSMSLSGRILVLKHEAEQAEQTASASRVRLSGILDNATEAIISFDEDGHILLYNRAAENIFGYMPRDIIDQPADTIIPGISQIFADGIQPQSEIYAMRRGGDIFPVEASGSDLRLNGQRIYSVFLRDITGRKQREAALRESESRFQHVFDHSPIGIFITDIEGYFTRANPAFQALTGYAESELHEMTYWEIIHPDDRAATIALWDELIRGQRSTYGKESRYLCRDGSTIWGSKIVSVFRGPDENASQVFGLVKGISERKQVEADLDRFRQHLEELVAQRTAQLEKSRSRLAILNQASRVVNSASLDADQIYVAIHQMAAWMMPVDVFSISLLNEGQSEIEDLYRAGLEGRMPGNRRPFKGSCVEWMLDHGRSLRVVEGRHSKTVRCDPDDGLPSEMYVLLQSGLKPMGALTVKSTLPHAYTEEDQKALEAFAAHVAIAIKNTRLYQKAQETAVSEERQRLARELHDSVTQLLYSMSLLSSGWKKMAQDGRLTDPAASFQQLEGIGLQALKEMRLLIHQLRPSILEEAGLVGALQQRLESVEQRVNVDTVLEVKGDCTQLSYPVEEQLYDIAQEALNNALRHAQAKTIEVCFQCQDGELSLTIRDNGVGFNPEASSSGLGLQSMRERAEMIGALLHITSESHAGTAVQVRVSL